MANMTQELLEKIKSGEAVDEALIPGHIKTPRIPDSVFTIVKKPNGEIFKRYLEADKWIAWINSVADTTIDDLADLSEKAIVGSEFYNKCKLSFGDIVRNGKELTGTTWIQAGVPYSISLQGNQVNAAKEALLRIRDNAIVPLTTTVKTGLNIDHNTWADQAKDLDDIVSGRC